MTTKSAPPPVGIYVPAVLFFDEHEEFDVPAIKAHILRLAKGGVAGILVQGSNGEAQHLSHDERKEAIRLTRATLNENGFEKVVVVAGTGAQSTRETKKLNQDAYEAGATFALVLTPTVWHKMMNTENILRFHREVADASPIPTMVYSFPGVTAGLDLDSDIILALAQHPNIVGTKLSCGNIGKIQRVASSIAFTEFATFPGRTDAFVHALNAGAAGAMTALVNLAPKTHTYLHRLWVKGKRDEAMALQAKLGHAEWAVAKIGGIGGIKAIISKNFGYGQAFVRGPLKSGDVAALDNNPAYHTVLDLIELEKSLEI
ncbi:dihydrodipicolinate synthetase [Coprinopsis sp. MPI-PUGE-AT-0042]|nr:dihydrodipicolinate synthetase [Coprinopsis sp. MPI-PUGE-AT-0042]